MKMKKSTLGILVAALVLVGCQGTTNEVSENTGNNTTVVEESVSKEDASLTVMTSTFVLEDVAKAIGGDKVYVESMIPNGQSPHGWEPSAKDLNKAIGTDVFLYNGGGLESWTDKVIEQLNPEETEVVETVENIALIPGHSHDHDHDHDAVEEVHDHDHDAVEEAHDHDHDHDHEHGALDPHVWLDPKNVVVIAQSVADAFAEKDSANADYYMANLESYKKELLDLDESFRTGLKEAKNRNIVVSHEAYGYLAKAYDLTQMPIEGINSSTEPDPKTMQEIIEFVKENNVKTIFTEPLIEAKVAETIANETGAEVAVLDPIEGVFDGNEKTYIDIMKENCDALVKALVE